jgi:prepilin-type N-terminal cleavage/methylation domain-containing protein
LVRGRCGAVGPCGKEVHDENRDTFIGKIYLGGGFSPLSCKKGFTLVEVIVVLVILAILAAIAIPALTGYIDKAQEKQYIAQARDFVQAVRAVINEAYAEGKFGSTTAQEYVVDGMSNTNTNLKKWWYSGLSNRATGSQNTFRTEALKLLSKTNATSPYDPGGYYELYYYAPSSSTGGFFESDAWVYFTHPEGYGYEDGAFTTLKPGKSVVEVTYHIKHINADTIAQFNAAMDSTAEYDDKTGYEVYHFTS